MTTKQLVSIIALILVLGGGWFFFGKQAIAPPTPLVEVPVETPKEIPEPPEKTEPIVSIGKPEIESIPNTNEVWYKIPELAIQMRMISSYANRIAYEYHEFDGNIVEHTGVIYFANKDTLVGKLGEILDDGKFFIALSRLKGDPRDNEWIQGKIGTAEMKEYDGYYVFLQKPAGVCRLDPIDTEKEKKNSMCYIFQTLEPVSGD